MPAGDENATIERPVLDHWAAEGTLTPGAYSRALELAGMRPDAAGWARFLDRLLGLMGALLFGAGVVFFIAHDWELLGRYAKFALVDAVIVAGALAAWWRGLDGIAGRGALWIATVAAGALLELVGQTYQTGADNYERARSGSRSGR